MTISKKIHIISYLLICYGLVVAYICGWELIESNNVFFSHNDGEFSPLRVVFTSIIIFLISSVSGVVFYSKSWWVHISTLVFSGFVVLLTYLMMDLEHRRFRNFDWSIDYLYIFALLLMSLTISLFICSCIWLVGLGINQIKYHENN